MIYFKIVNNNSRSDTYKVVMGLARNEHWKYERYDRKNDKWEEDFKLQYGISGLGDDWIQYQSITKAEATRLISIWNGEPK
jgi:hypothetical protein